MKINDKVIFQRDCKVPRGKKIIDAILDRSYKVDDLREITIEISANGKRMKLNVTAAIIFECLISGDSKDEIVSKFQCLFSSSDRDFSKDIDKFVHLFLTEGVLYER